MGTVGCGITNTGWVYILASTFRQVKEQMSYTAGAKGSLASRVYPRQGISRHLKMDIRAGIYKKKTGQ